MAGLTKIEEGLTIKTEKGFVLRIDKIVVRHFHLVPTVYVSYTYRTPENKVGCDVVTIKILKIMLLEDDRVVATGFVDPFHSED